MGTTVHMDVIYGFEISSWTQKHSRWKLLSVSGETCGRDATGDIEPSSREHAERRTPQQMYRGQIKDMGSPVVFAKRLQLPFKPLVFRTKTYSQFWTFQRRLFYEGMLQALYLPLLRLFFKCTQCMSR